MADIDFKALADALLRDAEGLLHSWFPNGVLSGHEFKIGSVEGEEGDSLSVNVNTGQWADFAGTDKGGDLISLYAASRGLSQLDAARELQGETANRLAVAPTRPKAPRAAPKWTPVLPVPPDAPKPPDRFARNEGTTKVPKWVDGKFVRRWTYHDADGRVLGHVARFHWTDADTGEIEKDVVPQTWCSNAETSKSAWRTRSFPVPRPLYGLRELAERPDAPVMVVEGEKSADAARAIAPQYVVVTWPGGIEAWRKAALNPLRGRSVLLWPDADEPGIKGMWEVGHALLAMCPTVKIILPSEKPDGWDADDARAEGWGWREFKEWALPRAVLVTETTGANDGRANDGNGAPARDAGRPGSSDTAGPGPAAGEGQAGGGERSPGVAHAGDRRGAGDHPREPGVDGEPVLGRSAEDRAARASADAGRAVPSVAAGEVPAHRGDRPEHRDDLEPAGRSGASDQGPAARPGGGEPGDRAAHEPGDAAAAGAAGPARLPAAAASSEPQSQVARWLAWGLDRNGNGAPLANLNNAVAIMEHDPRLQGIVWFDEFLQRMLTSDPPREWGEPDDINLTLYMQRGIGIQKMSRDAVAQAVKAVAYRNVRNCARDWVSGLQHDGTPRIEQFFADIFGADDTQYSRAASRNFWISLVARIFEPGCQVDNMVVLEGLQGKGKSSAVQVIGGEWYAAQHESPTNMRAFAEVLQGKVVVEIEEMHSFSRAENEAVKKAITVRKDRFRPSGAHGYAKDHPRTCIFVGTTNRDDWNKDETGARRYWPIRCTTVELALLVANRSQYFAEAAARFKQGETWWEMPEEDTKAEQQDRYDADPWMDAIAKFVEIVPSVTVGEIMQEALKIEIARFSRSDQMRVAACLRTLGWRQSNARRGNRVLKVWKPGTTVATVATGGNAQVVDSEIPF